MQSSAIFDIMRAIWIFFFMEPRIKKPRTYEFLCLLKSAPSREANDEALLNLRTVIEREGGEFPDDQNIPVSSPEDTVEIQQPTVMPTTETNMLAARATRDTAADYGAKRWRAPFFQTRQLAYPIQHETAALVATFEFQGLPDMPQRLKETLRHNPNILRYLLTHKIKHPKKHAKPKTHSLRTFHDGSTNLPEASLRPSTQNIDASALRSSAPPLQTDVPAPEAIPKPAPLLSPEEIDKRIEEIIG